MVNGRRISRSGATRKEALKRLEKATAGGVPLPRSGQRTVKDAIEVHMKHLDSRVAQGTMAPSTRDYYQQMLHHAPEGKLDTLRPSDIEKWLAQDFADKSASLRRGAFIALKNALRTARRDGLMTANPMENLVTPNGDREKEPEHATEEDVRQLLANAREPWRTLFLVIAYTGLRRGEALDLQWNDVDLIAKQLTVRSGKTPRARRAVPLVDEVVQALVRHRAQRTGDWVFPYDGRNTSRAFNRYRPREGLTIHGLRHGFVTRLLERGVPVHTVSSLAGHSSVSVTLDAYSHSVTEIERTAVELLRM
jgi:integrase